VADANSEALKNNDDSYTCVWNEKNFQRRKAAADPNNYDWSHWTSQIPWCFGPK
jgi:hypothetical protein